MLKTIPSDKTNGIKMPSFFFRELQLINLQLLNELKHNVRHSKTVCGIFIFYSISFLLKFIFLFNKVHELFDFKTS